MKISEIKTPADAHKVLRELCESQVTALNSLAEKFPEGMRAELGQLKDKLNGYLTGLQPLDQIPAAQEAAWAFNCLVNTISRSQEIVTELMTRLAKYGERATNDAAALNAFNEKITKKELLDATAVEAAVQKARDDEAKKFLPQIAAMRKNVIALAKLPDAPDDVLALNAEDFQKRLDGATANVKLAGEKGVKSEAFLKKNAWLETVAFNGEMDVIADIIKPTAKRDPLLGNPPKDKETAHNSAPATRRCVLG